MNGPAWTLPNFKPGNGKFPCWSTSWSFSIISYHKMNKNPSRHVLAGKSSSVISNHRWKVIFHWNTEGFRRFLKDPGLGHGFLRTCLRLFCHGATRQGLKTWGPYDVLYVVVNLRALLSGPIYIQCLYRIGGVVQSSLLFRWKGCGTAMKWFEGSSITQHHSRLCLCAAVVFLLGYIVWPQGCGMNCPWLEIHWMVSFWIRILDI